MSVAELIPPKETLEIQGYSPEEIEVLERLRIALVDDCGDDIQNACVRGREILKAIWVDDYTWIGKQHWINTPNPGEVVRLRWNYAQRRLHELIEKMRSEGRPVRILILKARQLGFSTFTQSYFYELCSQNPNTNALTVSYDQDATDELVQKRRMVREMEWFPTPLKRDAKSGKVETGAGKGNRLRLNNGSLLRAITAGADRLGRGDTFHYIHMSELAFWDDQIATLDSVFQTCRYKPGTMVFVESTANGMDEEFYRLCKNAMDGRGSYELFFAPWFWEPEYCVADMTEADVAELKTKLTPEDLAYKEQHSLSWGQMAWRERTIYDNCRGDRNKFKQEYPADPHEAFLTSGRPAFDPTMVSSLMSNAGPAVWSGNIDLDAQGHPELTEQAWGKLQIWQHPVGGREYTLGVDTATGKERDRALTKKGKVAGKRDDPDFSCVQVIDNENGYHVASLHGQFALAEYPYLVAALGYYYNTGEVVVETNGPGESIVSVLHLTIGYPNIYVDKRQGVVNGMAVSSSLGLRTDGNSRNHHIIIRLQEWLRDSPFSRDHATALEFHTMVILPDGKAAARPPNKDDRVLALGLACQGRWERFHPTEEPKPKDPYADLPAIDRQVWRMEARRQELADRRRNRDLADFGGPGRSPVAPNFGFGSPGTRGW